MNINSAGRSGSTTSNAYQGARHAAIGASIGVMSALARYFLSPGANPARLLFQMKNFGVSGAITNLIGFGISKLEPQGHSREAQLSRFALNTIKATFVGTFAGVPLSFVAIMAGGAAISAYTEWTRPNPASKESPQVKAGPREVEGTPPKKADQPTVLQSDKSSSDGKFARKTSSSPSGVPAVRSIQRQVLSSAYLPSSTCQPSDSPVSEPPQPLVLKAPTGEGLNLVRMIPLHNGGIACGISSLHDDIDSIHLLPKVVKDDQNRVVLKTHTHSSSRFIQLRDGCFAAPGEKGSLYIWPSVGGAPTVRHSSCKTSPTSNEIIQLSDGRIAWTVHKAILIWPLNDGEPTLLECVSDTQTLIQLQDGRLAVGYKNGIVIQGVNLMDSPVFIPWKAGARKLWQLDNGEIVLSDQSNDLFVCQPVAGASMRRFQGHTKQPDFVIQLHDGRIASACSEEDTDVIIWSLEGQIERRLNNNCRIDQLILLSDGRLAMTHYQDIYIWSPDADQPIVIQAGHTTTNLTQLSDGRIASSSFEGEIRIFDFSLKKLVMAAPSLFPSAGASQPSRRISLISDPDPLQGASFPSTRQSLPPDPQPSSARISLISDPDPLQGASFPSTSQLLPPDPQPLSERISLISDPDPLQGASFPSTSQSLPPDPQPSSARISLISDPDPLQGASFPSTSQLLPPDPQPLSERISLISDLSSLTEAIPPSRSAPQLSQAVVGVPSSILSKHSLVCWDQAGLDLSAFLPAPLLNVVCSYLDSKTIIHLATLCDRMRTLCLKGGEGIKPIFASAYASQHGAVVKQATEILAEDTLTPSSIKDRVGAYFNQAHATIYPQSCAIIPPPEGQDVFVERVIPLQNGGIACAISNKDHKWVHLLPEGDGDRVVFKAPLFSNRVIQLQDGRIAIPGSKGSLSIWRLNGADPVVRNNSLPHPLPHGDTILQLTDGRIAWYTQYGTIVVWPLNDGPPTSLKWYPKITSLIQLRDGRLASGHLDGTVRIQRVDQQEPPVIIPTGKKVDKLLELDNGEIMVSLDKDKDLFAVSPVEGAKLRKFHGHKNPPNLFVQLHDGRLVSICPDETEGNGIESELILWSLDGAIEKRLRHNCLIESLIQLADGRVAFCTSALYIWPLDKDHFINLKAKTDGNYVVQLSNGQIAMVSLNGEIEIFDIPAKELVKVATQMAMDAQEK